MDVRVETVAAAQAPARAAPRIASIDLMRGVVMIIMAIDHVRDYFSPFPYEPTDLSKASPALFLTRWITHFCAPTFVFLAGTSAFLYARGAGSRGRVQRFLLTRGLWLVLLELTWISFCWRFDLNGVNFQVIWALGWSMVVLAALLYLPRAAMAAVGLALVFGHNAFDGWHYRDFPGAAGWAWALLHEPRFETLASGYQIAALYPLVPWAGVMALGYVFGDVLLLPAAQRDRWMRGLGGAAVLLFILLRLSNYYGDAQQWTANARGTLYTLLDALNTTKYPPSLQYLLMTLGPVLLLLPWLERWRGALADRVTVFGRVPFFFYLLHLPLIHLASDIAVRIAFRTTVPAFSKQLPAGYEPSLARVYLVWLLLILLLYPLCRWYAGYKARHKEYWWLSYL
ncbi:MAG: heparan-alpha-glucosaminide N-acetyltransferase domain-containing protein [Nevskia sp.]|nr:heparan-alpha-glucosaminide N-acetyltransferase domain-containing protein [Nevskia sp.]